MSIRVNLHLCLVQSLFVMAHLFNLNTTHAHVFMYFCKTLCCTNHFIQIHDALFKPTKTITGRLTN
jgi:hypothetical protein